MIFPPRWASEFALSAHWISFTLTHACANDVMLKYWRLRVGSDENSSALEGVFYPQWRTDLSNNPFKIVIYVRSSTLECFGENRVIFLDLSKAFDDRIGHKGLLVKLPVFGLHYTPIKWIGSFLSEVNRSLKSRLLTLSFLILIQSMLVYLRALLSLLYYLSSSWMIYIF